MTGLCRWVGLGAMLSSCARPADPAADRATYAHVVADKDGAPAALLDLCAAIGDPVLAGDCSLHVVMVESRRPDGRPSVWCDAVPEGIWRSECWFVSAERQRKADDPEAAAQSCGRAGPFKEDCAQHLWQGDVHRLIHRAGPQAFGPVLPKAHKLHERWAPLVGGWSDFDSRFWAKFYQNGFEGAASFVDLAACDVLDPEDGARCVAAGTQMYARECGPRMDRWTLSICQDEPWTSRTLAPYVPARPDARLDAVLDAMRTAQCGG